MTESSPLAASEIRLVASDLDGTLLEPPRRRRATPNADGEVYLGGITERTRLALEALAQRDIDLVAVTGRPPRWVRDIGLMAGKAICSNGALVVDIATGEVLLERNLETDVMAEVLVRLRAFQPDGLFAVEYAGGVGIDPGWADLLPDSARSVQEASRRALSIAPAEDLVTEPAAKILMKVPGVEGDAFIDAAAEAVGDIAVVTASGGLQLVEVSAVGVDKATTLARLCSDRGIAAAEVVAFGDARNDLPMLAWAGTAVAMGDSHPSVIAEADHVTGTNADDGVAVWLERHVL